MAAGQTGNPAFSPGPSRCSKPRFPGRSQEHSRPARKVAPGCYVSLGDVSFPSFAWPLLFQSARLCGPTKNWRKLTMDCVPKPRSAEVLLHSISVFVPVKARHEKCLQPGVEHGLAHGSGGNTQIAGQEGLVLA